MSAATKVVKTKLFIGNLDPGTQQAELTDLFSSFGNVLEASVIKDYGFVHFGTIEEAEKAVAALNNKEFHGKRLRVELSTSTVRHRPGQPEPASALRNSRARAAMNGGNSNSRYNSSATTGGGGGPMRHNSSSWARNDSRPYDGIPLDPPGYNSGYGPGSTPYDRPRSDVRHYYNDRRDNTYGSTYDTSRDNLYGAPTGYNGGNNNGGQMDMYSMRDYRDESGGHHHHRTGNMNYAPNPIYDRNTGASPVDPYYGAAMSQGPSDAGDAYQNYDSYQKYYQNRPHDPDYLTSTGLNSSSRDYDPYSNYGSDPYAMPTNPSSLRNDVPVTYQQAKSGYPPSRQQSSNYGNAASSGSYPSSHAQYYGAQQRA